eukprot:TRINITY_DN16357_c0_g1_i5.p1 TRINITY_DN16357_c0_g1~~TRINITY_DN16357_c0_g1_i5.p1  ORF type:complete len:394 (-),score=47.22 TRINITY_DN16357_c0_g1_i5:114-1295(-)
MSKAALSALAGSMSLPVVAALDCFPAGFSYDLCCPGSTAFSECFHGDVAKWEACCVNVTTDDDGAAWPGGDADELAELWCLRALASTALETTVDILQYAYDMPALCKSFYSIGRSSQYQPAVLTVSSTSYRPYLDNFVANLAASAEAEPAAPEEGPIRVLTVLSLDEETEEMCQDLRQAISSLSIHCAPLPTEEMRDGFDMISTECSADRMYMLHWMKLAALRLLLEVGMSAVLWSEADAIMRRPLTINSFLPSSHQLQVGCLDAGTPLAGFGFASQLAIPTIDILLKRSNFQQPALQCFQDFRTLFPFITATCGKERQEKHCPPNMSRIIVSVIGFSLLRGLPERLRGPYLAEQLEKRSATIYRFIVPLLVREAATTECTPACLRRSSPRCL